MRKIISIKNIKYFYYIEHSEPIIILEIDFMKYFKTKNTEAMIIFKCEKIKMR
jgi:hypothetical protein